jgi:predicted Co/Zn/Cd cation transporter (cation efflux family)
MLPYPLTLQARKKLDFFVPEASFNVMGMFQNPMMLMMGVTAVVVLGLPYLLVSHADSNVLLMPINISFQKNLDPETMKEINESQAVMSKNLDLSSGYARLSATPKRFNFFT